MLDSETQSQDPRGECEGARPEHPTYHTFVELNSGPVEYTEYQQKEISLARRAGG